MMQPKVNPRVLTEYVGVERGSKKYKKLEAEVREILVEYPRLRARLDGHPGAQRRALDRLQKALDVLVSAFEELDEGVRQLLAESPPRSVEEWLLPRLDNPHLDTQKLATRPPDLYVKPFADKFRCSDRGCGRVPRSPG
jgi:hypothetical protein